MLRWSRGVAFVAATTAGIAIVVACDSFEEAEPPVPLPDASRVDEDASSVDGEADAPVDAGGPSETFARIAAGHDVACAIRNDQVYCWGNNKFGAAGQGGEVSCFDPDGGNADAGTCRPTPRLITNLEGKKIVDVAAGNQQACARTDSGEVWCWGSNASLRLGVAKSVVAGASPTPVQVPIPRAYSLTLGNSVGCAKVDDKGKPRAWCWGFDANGELGRGVLATSDAGPSPEGAPGSIAWDADIDQVVVGNNLGCARAGKEIRCWGVSSYGSLGHPGGTQNDVPCPFAATQCNAVPTAVSATGFRSLELVAAVFACGVDDVAPRCWGSNAYGTLGQGSFDSNPHPVPDTPAAVTTALSAPHMFRGRTTHACALDADGALWCWGSNVTGELGGASSETCGSAKCSTSPLKVGALPKIVEIAPGHLFTIARAEDDQIFTWGSNLDGRLGHVPGTRGDNDCPAYESVPAAKCNPIPHVVAFP